jgi:hypothetical protein
MLPLTRKFLNNWLHCTLQNRQNNFTEKFRKYWHKKLATNTIHQFKINKLQQFERSINWDAATVLANLNKDPGYLVKELADSYNTLIAPKYDEINQTITALQRIMKAQLELNTDSRIFPDANSVTLRKK